MNPQALGPSATPAVGDLLRTWRQRRRLSQLALSVDAGVSTRHLSFVESGRAMPSRDMLLNLAEHLAVPLRERNTLLLSAGYAPMFPQRTLDDPDMHAARQAVDLVLRGHEPYPALAVDRHWTLVAANAAVGPLLAGVDPVLLASPMNVLRLSMHPGGLADRIVNYTEWRDHILARLHQQVVASGDATLEALEKELAAYPLPGGWTTPPRRDAAPTTGALVVPLQLRTDAGVLSFISTTTVFGTPVDVTLSELAIESLFPADARTAEILRRMAEAQEG
jgi:transcriptional regulator with XRE-family HTH domain